MGNMKVEERNPYPVCPICKDALKPSDLATSCPSEHVWVHGECTSLAKVCTVMGCGQKFLVPRRVASELRPLKPSRDGDSLFPVIAGLAGVALVLCLGYYNLVYESSTSSLRTTQRKLARQKRETSRLMARTKALEEELGSLRRAHDKVVQQRDDSYRKRNGESSMISAMKSRERSLIATITRLRVANRRLEAKVKSERQAALKQLSDQAKTDAWMGSGALVRIGIRQGARLLWLRGTKDGVELQANSVASGVQWRVVRSYGSKNLRFYCQQLPGKMLATSSLRVSLSTGAGGSWRVQSSAPGQYRLQSKDSLGNPYWLQAAPGGRVFLTRSGLHPDALWNIVASGTGR